MRLFAPPEIVRNPISFAGAAIASTMAALFIVLAALEWLGLLDNPYVGLLTFIAVPALFVLGLLLIPAGAWWAARRRRRTPADAEWPAIDLANPRHRTTAFVVFALTLVNLVVVSLGAYGGLHYMESRAFCGQVCHVPMEPQFRAAAAGPHANVACVQCHVGPGAGAAIDAKLAGVRQLYHVVTGQVPRPIPSPADLIRPAHVTCEGCHWPQKAHGDVTRVIREYANDEANSETTTTLRLHVGGGYVNEGAGSGIHWHMNLANRVEYVATDDTLETIPYVRVTDRSGAVREYVAAGADRAQLASAPRRRMECTDCHNRPAHTFHATAERAIDRAIADGRLPRELPFARREAVAAVTATYPDRDAALRAIAERLRGFYASRTVEARLVSRAVAATQDLWSTNVFPSMRVTWGTYLSRIGHVDSPGCFRCHDDEHKTAEGRAISQDCELCHTAPE